MRQRSTARPSGVASQDKTRTGRRVSDRAVKAKERTDDDLVSHGSGYVVRGEGKSIAACPQASVNLDPDCQRTRGTYRLRRCAPHSRKLRGCRTPSAGEGLFKQRDGRGGGASGRTRGGAGGRGGSPVLAEGEDGEQCEELNGEHRWSKVSSPVPPDQRSSSPSGRSSLDSRCYISIEGSRN